MQDITLVHALSVLHPVACAQFNRPAELPTLIHPMLYNTKADKLFGEYFDHGRRAIWLGKQVGLCLLTAE